MKPHIRLSALIDMAVKNLRFKKLRSGLTIVGIAIGVGSVFLLMSFGLGLQDLVAKQITDGQSVNTIDVSASGSRVLKMNEDVVKNIAAIPHVESASGFYAKASKLAVSSANADVVLYGVDTLYLDTANIVMSAGVIIDPTDHEQIIISDSILEALGITDFSQILGSSVEATVKVTDTNQLTEKFTVVGVIASGNGSEAFVSSGVFRTAGAKDFVGVKILVDNQQHVQEARRAVEALGYDTASPVDTLDQIDQFFAILRVILVSFGLVGMVIAVLGMVNTLTVSLLERTREVALMLALGGRPRDMKRLFIIEAIILSLVGAVLGILGAIGLGAVIDVALNYFAQSRGATAGFTVFAVPLWLLIATLVFMLCVGYLVAYFPARRASRVNPVETLRGE